MQSAQDTAQAITTKRIRHAGSMFLAVGLLESKMEVTFTDRSRSMLKTRKGFLTTCLQSFNRPMEYATQYENEYLYKEGDDEYWLATEAPVTKYFDNELQPVDKMEMYLISIGTYRIDKGIDCVFLVEEYKK